MYNEVYNEVTNEVTCEKIAKIIVAIGRGKSDIESTEKVAA